MNKYPAPQQHEYATELLLAKKGDFFCFDGSHAFDAVHGSHEAFAEMAKAQERGADGAGAADTAARGSVLTPTNNMGVNSKKGAKAKDYIAAHHDTIELVIDSSGEVAEIPLRRGHGDDSAFVDWLNMTFLKTTALRYTTKLSGLTNETLIEALSVRLEWMLGFGVTAKRPSGSNFYKESYVLGDNWGQVCIGGQNDTILVMLTGKGCTAALKGWEHRVFQFLTEEAIAPRISRIDLTFDDIEGVLYSVEQARADRLAGLFQLRAGKPPMGQCLGDWDTPDGSGRTYTVGRRSSGRYTRVYEKGMELGCKNHPWVRVELEMKSENIVIPFDVLLKAGAYLSGTYPAFHWISDHKADRPMQIKKTIEVNVNKAIEIVRHQFGNYINILAHMFGPENVLKLITRDDKVPDRLKVPDLQFAPTPIHRIERDYFESEEIVSLANPHLNFDTPEENQPIYDDFYQCWTKQSLDCPF